MEVKGRHKVIEVCHPLKPVVRLGVEGLRVFRGKVRRGKAKVEEDRGEVVHKGARPLFPE